MLALSDFGWNDTSKTIDVESDDVWEAFVKVNEHFVTKFDKNSYLYIYTHTSSFVLDTCRKRLMQRTYETSHSLSMTLGSKYLGKIEPLESLQKALVKQLLILILKILTSLVTMV